MDALLALQTSIDIVGKLRSLSKKVQDAEFRMLVADLSNALADAKLDLAALKEELAESKTAGLASLRTECANLRADLTAKEAECTALTQQVSVLSDRLVPSGASKLEPLQEALLQLLAEHDRLTDAAIAEAKSMNRQVVAYHIEALRARNFIASTRYDGVPSYGVVPKTFWSIQHAGREYLIQSGLLA